MIRVALYPHKQSEKPLYLLTEYEYRSGLRADLEGSGFEVPPDFDTRPLEALIRWDMRANTIARPAFYAEVVSVN